MAYKIRLRGAFDRAPPGVRLTKLQKDPHDIGKGRIFRQLLSFLKEKHGRPQLAKGP